MQIKNKMKKETPKQEIQYNNNSKGKTTELVERSITEANKLTEKGKFKLYSECKNWISNVTVVNGDPLTIKISVSKVRTGGLKETYKG